MVGCMSQAHFFEHNGLNGWAFWSFEGSGGTAQSCWAGEVAFPWPCFRNLLLCFDSLECCWTDKGLCLASRNSLIWCVPSQSFWSPLPCACLVFQTLYKHECFRLCPLGSVSDSLLRLSCMSCWQGIQRPNIFVRRFFWHAPPTHFLTLHLRNAYCISTSPRSSSSSYWEITAVHKARQQYSWTCTAVRRSRQ